LTESPESLALQATRLYSEGLTHDKIGKELEISKGRVGKLIREGIESILSLDNHEEKPDAGSAGQPNNDQENNVEPKDNLPSNNPIAHQGLEEYPPYFFPPQDPRSGSYTLETSGIGRRVLLTPKDIMIFDLWKGAGFQGDLSDFISDSINFMYESRRPRERPNY